MLRMAHRISTAEMFIPVSIQHRCDLTSWFNKFRDDVEQSIVIEATNVASYYASLEGKQWTWGDVEMARPPFGLVFIEWSLDGIQYGCLINTTPDAEPKVTVSTFMFSAQQEGKLKFLDVWMDIRYATHPVEVRYGDYAPEEVGNIDGDAWQLLKQMQVLVHIPMLALAFMNCKNVVRRDVTAEVGPTPKWIRRQKAPTIRYHVLDINPMKEVLRTEGGIEHNGLKKALHICRGHFAHYENGLFGRGDPCTIWKPSHVRGQAEQGIVLKDYRIKTGT